MLLLLVYFVLLVPFIRSQELTNNQKCFYRCTASCVGSGQNSGFCEEECSSYNNINLCNTSDCWSLCRDLGPPTSLTVPSGIHMTNDNGTRGVRWSPVSLAGAYLVQLKEQSDPDFSTSPIEVTGNTSLEDVLVQRNAFCDPMDVRVASASKTSVSGFSEVKKVDKPKPGASPKLLLKELKYLNRPFVDDFYEANGTIQITFEYQPYEWTLGESDLQIEPMFHMITCSDPDLSQGVPIPQFAPGPEPNTVVGFVGSDMMYRKCRFVYYVQEVRSKTCGTNTFFHSPPPDALQTMNIECGTVLNNPCVIEERHEPPVCGQVEDITYKIMNDDVDSDDVSRNLTVNVTFVPMMRTREAPTLYYVAFYGIAMNYKSKEEEAFLGVNITKMLGRVSNCKSLTSAGLCAHETTNDVFLEDMHLDTLYGITFCAVKDPNNLTFPDFLADSRQRRPKANRIYLDGRDIHRRRARNAKTTNKTTTKTPVSHATTTKTTTLPVSTQTTEKPSKATSEAPAKTKTTAKPTTESMTTKTSIPTTVNSTAKTLAKTKTTKKVPKSTPTSKRTTNAPAKKKTTTKSSKRPVTSRKTPSKMKVAKKPTESGEGVSGTHKSTRKSTTQTNSKTTETPKTSQTTTKQSTSKSEKPKEYGEKVSDLTTKTSQTKTTSKAAETTTKQSTTKLANESGKEISHSATKTTPKVTASPKTTEITTARTTTTTSAKPKDCEEKFSKLEKSKGKFATSTTLKTPATKTKSNTTTKQSTSRPTTEKSTTKSTTQQSTNETSAKQSTSKPTTRQSSSKTSTREPTTEATTQKSTTKTSTKNPRSKSTTKNSTSKPTTQKSTSGTLTKKSSSKSTTKNSTSESTTQKSTSKSPTKKSTIESTTQKTTSKSTTTSSTTPTTTKTKQKTTHPPKTNAKIKQTSIELTTEVSQTEALKAKPAPKKTTKRRKTTVQPTKSIPTTTKKPVKITTTKKKKSTTETSSPSTRKTNKIFILKTNTTNSVNVKIGSKPGRAALPMHPTNRKSTTTKTTSVRKSPIEDGGIIELMSRNFAKSKVGLIVGVSIGAIAFVILCLIGLCLFINKKQKAKNDKFKLKITQLQLEKEHRYTDFPKKNDIWEIERRNLIIHDDKKLGSGAFGAVYLGKLLGKSLGHKDANSPLGVNIMRAENCEVAVKMLPEYADEMSKSEFLREIGLMKTLGYHERLVNMLACVTDSEPLCLVVEYCSDGDLLHFLRDRCKYMMKLDEVGINYQEPPIDDNYDIEKIITMKQLLMYAVQISYGLEYLSQKGFVHRDVAARNILVNDINSCKIGDFGLCRFIYADSAHYKSKGGRLPLKWMSPEAIRHYEFSTMSDVWSFGILLFEIITLGGSPYPGVQPEDMLSFLEDGGRMEQPDNCPDEFYSVMVECWHAVSDKRPEFSTIRQQLAGQLEDITEEYSYLKLDAQRDYYNVQYKDEKHDIIVIPETDTISGPRTSADSASTLSIESIPMDSMIIDPNADIDRAKAAIKAAAITENQENRDNESISISMSTVNDVQNKVV